MASSACRRRSRGLQAEHSGTGDRPASLYFLSEVEVPVSSGKYNRARAIDITPWLKPSIFRHFPWGHPSPKLLLSRLDLARCHATLTATPPTSLPSLVPTGFGP